MIWEDQPVPHYHLFHLHLNNCPNPVRLGYSSSREGQACMEAVLGRVQKAVDLGCYRLTASVRATNLLDLYQKTNAAGPDWIGGAEIQRIGGATRVTGFGDIAVDVDAGQVFSMWRGGWKEHSIENCAQLFLSSHHYQRPERLEPEPELVEEETWEACAL